jgi:hypothetical protein
VPIPDIRFNVPYYFRVVIISMSFQEGRKEERKVNNFTIVARYGLTGHVLQRPP